MKKYISILIVLIFMGGTPLAVLAQDTEPESVQSADIADMNKNIQDIEQVVQTSTPAQTSADPVVTPTKKPAGLPRPADVTVLDRDVLPEINQAIRQSREIPAPVNLYGALSTANLEPTLLSPDEILDSVIQPENRVKTMDLQFEEVNLESILHTIGEAAKINIVLDPALKNSTLSLHLKGVKIHEALSLMAESYNLAFKKIGNSLFVTTKERVHGDNLSVRLINLRYAKAADVKEMAHNFLNSINVSQENNSITVVGTPDEIAKIESLVKSMDRPQPQVILEAKIIEINKDAEKTLGVQWSQSITTNFQETNRPVSFNNIQSSVGSAVKLYSMARSPVSFSTTLQMLENDNLAKVLASPRVITVNNKLAEIFVGDEYPYTVTTITNGVATNDVRFAEPGIRLKITPSIIDKDFVQIKIEPEVSYIYSFVGPQNQYPWIKTRTATADVRLQNKQPFVLGGLLDKEDQKNLYKVPLLGNIPWLGNLFSYTTHDVTNDELIIVVVPVVVNQ